MPIELSENEKGVIEKFASKLKGAYKKQLLTDLNECYVSGVSCDRSSILLGIRGYTKDKPGQHLVPVEGEMKDSDGTRLTVYVYLDPNNRLCELEFIKYADSPLIAPDWSTLVLRDRTKEWQK